MTADGQKREQKRERGGKKTVIGTQRLIHLLAAPAVKSKHAEQDAHTAFSLRSLGQTHLTEITRRLRGCRDRGVTRGADMQINPTC